MDSLKGKTVLVTGADGFIGSHLVERLVADGANVRAFCVYNSQYDCPIPPRENRLPLAIRAGERLAAPK